MFPVSTQRLTRLFTHVVWRCYSNASSVGIEKSSNSLSFELSFRAHASNGDSQSVLKLVSDVIGQKYRFGTGLPKTLPNNNVQESTDTVNQPKKIIFSQKTMFYVLNVAYDEFLRNRNNGTNRRDCLLEEGTITKRCEMAELDDDDDDYVEGPSNKSMTNHIYERILNAIQQGDSLRKRRRFHGAILLAHDESMQFLDEYKMTEEKISVEDVDFLCNLAKNVKEPRILAPLIDLECYLPKRNKTIAKIYETITLLYGQKRDIENLARVCSILLCRKRPLDEYRHALHRIRHFFRCANVVAPPKLLKAITIIDPSVRA